MKIMLQNEYEERIGRKVTPEEYAKADMVYLASSLEKDDFCQYYEAENKLIHDLSDRVHKFEKVLPEKSALLDKVATDLVDAYYESNNGHCRESAIAIMGRKVYAKYVLERYRGALTPSDCDLIGSLLNSYAD